MAITASHGAARDLPSRRRARHAADDADRTGGTFGADVTNGPDGVTGTQTLPRPRLVVADGDRGDVPVVMADPVVLQQPDPPVPPPASGPVAHLLHCAVALQAEDLLRTIGALAVAAHRSVPTTATVDWIAWVERDVRDLGLLATAALAAGATLPAGLDVGGGDPERPETVVEGLLAGHEAVLRVLRPLAALGGDAPWADVVGRITARRGAEAAALRVTVGTPAPREPERTHVGRSPDRHATPDLLV